MPAPKKKTGKAAVKVKDLKAKKNPKGGHSPPSEIASKHKLDRGIKAPNAAHKFSW